MALVAFSADPLNPDARLDARRFGMPGHPSVQELDVRSHARDDDPGWFDDWHTGALAAIAERDLPDPAVLRAARHCHLVRLEVDDPADLGHLQVAWAVAGWLISQGSYAVLDAHAHRWHSGAAVAALAPDRPFVLDAEAGIVVETGDGPGLAVHTRGMAKFARPDLIGMPERSERDLMAQVLWRLARLSADGADIPVGQRMRFDEQHAFTTVGYQPDVNAPQVNLNNDGLLIVPV